MRAKISIGVPTYCGLRPDLYPADRAFLVAESEHEARAILSETEQSYPHRRALPYAIVRLNAAQDPVLEAHVALAEALARFLS